MTLWIPVEIRGSRDVMFIHRESCRLPRPQAPGPDLDTMSAPQYVHYRGLLLPSEAHNKESLEFAQSFSVEDTDVLAVTYPKSGAVFISRPADVGVVCWHFNTGQQLVH